MNTKRHELICRMKNLAFGEKVLVDTLREAWEEIMLLDKALLNIATEAHKVNHDPD